MPGLKDMDYLAARLHGRRARLAEGPRLRALCALGSPAALGEALFPGAGLTAAADIQARLAEEFIKETLEIRACLSGARAAFIEWQAARFQLENLKLIVRALAAGRDPAAAARLLIRLPACPGYGAELGKAKNFEELLAALPRGVLRGSLQAAYAAPPPAGAPFFYEARLDRDYLREMAARAAALGGEDGELAGLLCAQEAAVFNLELAARGINFHGFEKGALLELLASGPGLGPKRFPELPGSGAESEGAGPEQDGLAAAWRRCARLAARSFRRGHMEFGAAAGYVALRRAETSNLITVAEGLRLGLAAEEILRRLVPLSLEGHV